MSKKTKLWFKIEKMVAEKLGLRRIGFSGGRWPNKEDAEDTNIICQVKATKGKQITIKGTDLKSLYTRSFIQHKIPLFVFHIESIEFDEVKTWVAIPINEFKKNIYK